MSEFPTLEEMGINNPREIVRYSLQTIDHTDQLRIHYKRKKGSLLPVSKRFNFGRSEKMVVADSGTRSTAIVHDISPYLQKVISELDTIVGEHRSSEELHAIIKEEINSLESELSSRIAHLNDLLEKL